MAAFVPWLSATSDSLAGPWHNTSRHTCGRHACPTSLVKAHPRADAQPGLAVEAAARRNRRDTYPELGRARRCRLVGGRFGAEAAQLLRLLARQRAEAVPAHLRPTAINAWVARWSGLLQ